MNENSYLIDYNNFRYRFNGTSHALIFQFTDKMGQTLSEPITAKESSSLQNSFVKVGSSSMQGWRISMEDAHTHILTMADDKDASFFAGKH